ncbi:MAG TPA: hypothetical protein VF587_07410, partial [Solirubrobacteraceae bacterium]
MHRLLFLLLALLALPATALAEPRLDGEFPVDSKPAQLTLGPDGNVWFVTDSDEIGRITPDGTVSDDFPHGMSGAARDITAGGGRLWLSQDDSVIAIDPADPENPEIHSINEIGTARGVAREADGDLWVVDDFEGTVVEVSADGQFKRELPGKEVKGVKPSGRDIVVGGDGKLYWADFNGPSIQVTDPVAGTTKALELTGGNPQELAVGPDGQVWFSSPNSIVGRIAPDGTVDETTNTNRDGFGAVFANDDAYWFAELTTGTLGRLTPGGELTHPIDLGATSKPRHITKGAGDTLWVSLEEMGKERIARITGVSAPEPLPEDPGPVA